MSQVSLLMRFMNIAKNLTVTRPVLPDRVDDFQPQISPKHAHFNKNQPRTLTTKIMWYHFTAMAIKVDKDHFYLLKIIMTK